MEYTGSGQPDPMILSLTGPCIAFYSQAVNDTGKVTIPAGALEPSGDPSQSAAGCQVTLAIRRWRAGMLDPAFGYGGSIQCEQDRSELVTVTP